MRCQYGWGGRGRGCKVYGLAHCRVFRDEVHYPSCAAYDTTVVFCSDKLDLCLRAVRGFVTLTGPGPVFADVRMVAEGVASSWRFGPSVRAR